MIRFIITLIILLVSASYISADLPLSELSLASAQLNDQFGYSVSVSNNLAVIGSPYVSINPNPNCGAVSIWQYNFQLSKWNSLVILSAYDRFNGDNFGSSVSLSSIAPPSSISARVLIGSPYHNTIFTASGIAYLYEQLSANASQWNNITQLFPSTFQTSANFGYSLCLSPLYAAVSAPFYDGGSIDDGTTYLYGKDHGGINNWGFITKVSASDPHSGDYFGWSISIDGDFILISSVNGDSININAGTAYLFSKDFGGPNNWGMMKRLALSNSITNDGFGCSVSISGDYILIGAHGVQSNTGNAYLFYRNNEGVDQWGLTSNISQTNGQIGDNFGFSVALQGSNIVIGAPSVNSVEGMIYVAKIHPDGTVASALIVNDSAPMVPNDFFGYSVGINDNLILIGARNKSGTGKAYSIELPNFSSIPPLCSTLCRVLIIMGVIFTVIASSIGIGIMLRRYGKFKSASGGDEDDLLEFSPRKDMNFIDMHGLDQKRKRPLSIQSGISVATSSTQYSNSTINTTTTNTSGVTLMS